MSNYEKQEGDFLLNDNGPKKRTENDPDGTAKYHYKGADYKMKVYLNKEKRQGKKDPDFKGSVDINGTKADVILWKTIEKRTEKSPDLTGKITIGDTKYPVAAWAQSGRFGPFWSGKTSFDRGEPAGPAPRGQVGGGMNSAPQANMGGMGQSQSQSGYDGGNRNAPDFDMDSDIPF